MSSLPSLRLDDTARQDAPPHPLDEPDLFDGVLWRRSVGYLVDVGLIGALYLCLWIVVGLAGILSFGLLTPVGIVFLAVLPASYHTYFIGHDGGTPGQRLFDLEVRSWTGDRVEYSQAFLNTVLFYTSVMLTAWLILAVPLFNDRRRAVHDFLAGTLVVRRARVAGQAAA